MKGRFWRKALAAALALLIVSGSVPVQPFSRVFDDISITANAEGVTLSEDNDIAEGTAGHYYVNMPATGTNTLTLTEQDIADCKGTFKVYDDGGKGPESGGYCETNYSKRCEGTLQLTVPDNYVICLSGRICTNPYDPDLNSEITDYLRVWDGTNGGTLLIDQLYSEGAKNVFNWKDVGSDIKSTGNIMTLYFKGGTTGIADRASKPGLDLTVTLIDLNAEYNVNHSMFTGGAVSSVDKAHHGDSVTLTATPEDGYLLNEILVSDSSGSNVPVTGGTWWSYNDTDKAVFSMPDKDVTVTPSFTDDMTAETLSVNMPAGGGIRNVVIPEGVTSFKVYDDGGKDSNYSKNYTGQLLLTAPENCILRASGRLYAMSGRTEYYLDVYNGAAAESDKRIIHVSTTDGKTKDIDTNYGDSRYMLITFESADVTNPIANFDFTVEVVDKAKKYDIAIDNVEHGKVTAGTAQASHLDQVTLTAEPDAGYMLEDIIVKDASQNTIVVNGNHWYDYNDTEKATFVMPKSAVSVTPRFTAAKTAEDGLYINMPKSGNAIATLPDGITSFKVYDDGGKDGLYSSLANGTLTLKAPENTVLVVAGNVKTSAHIGTALDIYDGENTGADKLTENVKSADTNKPVNIGRIISTDNTMTLSFYAGEYNNTTGDGLDLNVSLLRSDVDYDVSVVENEHGTVTVNKDKARIWDKVVMTVVPEDGYLLEGITVTDANGNNVRVSGDNWYTYNDTDKASFVMPPSDVTLTPSFTAAKTAAEGLSVNMPKSGVMSLNVPDGVTSLMVYDDGGTGKYSAYADGDMIIHAPSGYKQVKISGSLYTEPQSSFTVYDGSDTNVAKLIDGIYSYAVMIEKKAELVTSTGKDVRLHFSTGSTQYHGLYITVEFIPNTYLVSFDANGGEGTAMSDQSFTYGAGQTLTENSYTRTGYTFSGWNTATDGTGTDYADKENVKNLTDENDATVKLFAQWTPIEYEIEYVLNGGTNASANPATYTIESADITLADPTNGETPFLGWYDNAEFTGEAVTGIPKGSTDKKTFYARWAIPITGAKVTLSESSFTYNRTVQKPTITSVKLGDTTLNAEDYDVSYSDGCKDVGTYTVTVTGKGCYYLTAEATFEIESKPVTVSGITASNKTYDGKTNATLDFSDVAFEGLCSGDILTVSATGAFADANAGEGKTVTISGLILGGADAENYILATSGQQTSTTADITKKAITPAVSVSDWEYGKTASTPSVTGNIGKGDVTYTYSSDGTTFSEDVPTNAGNYTIKANVAETTNYLAGESTATFKITKAQAEVTTPPTAKSLAYNGDEQELITAGSTDFGTLLYSLDGETYSSDIPKATNAGTYTVYYKIEGSDNWNAVEPQTVEVTIVDSYTVIWKNGTNALETDSYVPAGTMPSYDGATPTKAGDARYSYTFSGWSDGTNTYGVNDALPTVSNNVTYMAQFSSMVNKYTITWVDGDGNTLKTEQVAYGETPAYTGDTPTKTATAQYSYTFTGWDSELSSVTGNKTYKAQFDSTVNKYTVTWKNGDTTIETDTDVEYGTMAEYNGATPTKAADAQYTYTFSGWDKEISAVTSNVTYTAQFSETVNKYTVNFIDTDGVTVLADSQTINWNEKATAPTAPIKDGAIFLYWTVDGLTAYDFDTPVTAETTLTAVWADTENFIKLSGTSTVTDNQYDGVNNRDYVRFEFAVNMENDNFTVVQHGILYGMNVATFGSGQADENLRFTDETAVALMSKVKEFSAQNTATQTTDWIEVYIGSNRDGIVYARGFIIVTDGMNNYLVYSDVASGSFNSFSANG